MTVEIKMPRTQAQLEQLREDRREQILGGALRVFATKGIARAQMSDVAREAGLGRGTVYWYFKSKDELVSAVIEAELDSFLAMTREAGLRESPMEALEWLIARMFELVAQRPEQMQFLLRVFVGDGFGKFTGRTGGEVFHLVRVEIAALLERFRAAGAIAPHIDLPTLASLFMALGDGLALQFLADPNAVDIAHAQKLLMQLAGAFVRLPTEEQ